MIKIVCSRSGLTFEAENRRKKVHPEISYYTSHKDMDLRYAAVAVIERGKAEGWKSLEKFKQEIEKALTPVEEPQPEYDFEGAWVARIIGSHPKFKYEREFLEKVGSSGRFNHFKFKEDGLYQTCYKSAKGNQTRTWILVQGGSQAEIDEDRVVEILSEKDCEVNEESELDHASCTEIKADKYLGQRGQKIQHKGNWYTIVDFSASTTYEDEDGIISDYYPVDTECVSEITQYIYWLKPLCEADAEAEQAALEDKQTAKLAAKRLAELANGHGYTTPEKAMPQGRKISYQHKELNYDSPYLQIDETANLLWSVAYNGRDGDDWRYNNTASGTQIASCIKLTPELLAELNQLAAVLCKQYPKAVQQ